MSEAEEQGGGTCGCLILAFVAALASVLFLVWWLRDSGVIHVGSR